MIVPTAIGTRKSQNGTSAGFIPDRITTGESEGEYRHGDHRDAEEHRDGGGTHFPLIVGPSSVFVELHALVTELCKQAPDAAPASSASGSMENQARARSEPRRAGAEVRSGPSRVRSEYVYVVSRSRVRPWQFVAHAPVASFDGLQFLQQQLGVQPGFDDDHGVDAVQLAFLTLSRAAAQCGRAWKRRSPQ